MAKVSGAGSGSLLLRRSGEAMRQLFDLVEGVQCWVKDVGGVYQWVNRAFLLNYSLDASWNAVVGKTDYDLSPKHLAEQFVLDDQRVLAGEGVHDRLELVGRFDHVATWNRTTKVPVKGARGEVLGTAGITRRAEENAIVGHVDLGLARVLAYIRDNHADAPSNEVLAAVAGRSIRALERAFSKELHLSPQQFLRRIRVRCSCHDLVFCQWPLSEVALRHGFCDQSHFTREFRLETGMTPRAYRKLYQSGK
ncbi:MAG: hypothetical protein RLZZ142_2193 [Verrucomicrobiota bacterium]